MRSLEWCPLYKRIYLVFYAGLIEEWLRQKTETPPLRAGFLSIHSKPVLRTFVAKTTLERLKNVVAFQKNQPKAIAPGDDLRASPAKFKQ